jgi:hypothetical protein
MLRKCIVRQTCEAREGRKKTQPKMLKKMRGRRSQERIN